MESTVKLCDKCGKAADCEFRIWHPGESMSVELDLCLAHGKPILELLELGREAEIPPKPRQRMIITELKTTKDTAQFKKKRTPPKR